MTRFHPLPQAQLHGLQRGDVNAQHRQDLDRQLVVVHAHGVHLLLLRLLQQLDGVGGEGGGGGRGLHVRQGLGLRGERESLAWVVRQKEVGESEEQVVENGVGDRVLAAEGQNAVVVASGDGGGQDPQVEGLAGLVAEGRGVEEAEETGAEGVVAITRHELVDGGEGRLEELQEVLDEKGGLDGRLGVDDLRDQANANLWMSPLLDAYSEVRLVRVALQKLQKHVYC